MRYNIELPKENKSYNLSLIGEWYKNEYMSNKCIIYFHFYRYFKKLLTQLLELIYGLFLIDLESL